MARRSSRSNPLPPAIKPIGRKTVCEGPRVGRGSRRWRGAVVPEIAAKQGLRHNQCVGYSERQPSIIKEFGGIVNRRSVLRMGMILAAGAVVLGYSLRRQTNASAEYRQQVELAREEADHIRQSMVLPTVQGMPAGENFSGVLRKFGLSTEQAADATAAAQQTFNLRHLRPGNTLTVNRSVNGALRDINYKIDAQRMLHLVPQPLRLLRRGQRNPDSFRCDSCEWPPGRFIVQCR